MLAMTAAGERSTRLAVLEATARTVAHEMTASTRAAKLRTAIVTMVAKVPNIRVAPQAPIARTAAMAIEAMQGVEAVAAASISLST